MAETAVLPTETADVATGASLSVDTEFVDDGDSTYSTIGGANSELTSLSSSVTAYVYENGRRYHAYKAGKYLIPNDDEEQDREDMKHHWCKLVMGGALTLAEIGDNPGKILDLGTGTGIWCIEMGDEYPNAEIIGNDLSRIQPSWVPPNVSFEVDDWDDDWTYGENRFNFIHNRFNCTAVSDWPGLLAKTYVGLKPGGWIELKDISTPAQSDDNTIPENSQVQAFFEQIRLGCSKSGRDLQAPYRFKSLLQEAGFVNVQERIMKVPIGGWPKDPILKEAGVFYMETFREGLPAIGMGFMTRVLDWRPEEVQVFFAGVRKELDNKRHHMWVPLFVVTAQKPEK